MFLPCFFAALTTAVAFLSLLLGDLKPVIEFGKMMAFGISIAFIFTFSFLPSSLSLIKKIKAMITYRFIKLLIKFYYF